ncbi:MAG TPA: pyrrolo-quinoline quinone, partial [Gammaproteobacteria bacterium]|nr:pyrrolo-quinoline quinone [Gammaproteobacteria bacterium]
MRLPATTTMTAVCAAVLGALAWAATAQQQQRTLRPVTDAMLQNPDAADWLSWRRTLNHWGYSPLNEINKRNVAQ